MEVRKSNVTQHFDRPPIPESKREDLAPAKMESGATRGFCVRADVAVTPDDLPKNRQRDPKIDEAELAAIPPPAPKERGVRVECDPGERVIAVYKDDTKVCNVRWMPQGKFYLVYERRMTLGEAHAHEYKASFADTWQVLGRYGVSAKEIQYALVSKPEYVMDRFDFSLCPEGRQDCSFDLAGNPAHDDTIQIKCRRCSALFEVATGGQVTARGTDAGQVVKPVIEQTKPNFKRFLITQRGVNAATIDALNDIGIDSWELLARAQPKDLMKIKGMTRVRAEVLCYWGKEFGSDAAL